MVVSRACAGRKRRSIGKRAFLPLITLICFSTGHDDSAAVPYLSSRRIEDIQPSHLYSALTHGPCSYRRDCIRLALTAAADLQRLSRRQLSPLQVSVSTCCGHESHRHRSGYFSDSAVVRTAVPLCRSKVLDL